MIRRLHKWWTVRVFAPWWSVMAESAQKEQHRRFIEAYLDTAQEARNNDEGQQVPE